MLSLDLESTTFLKKSRFILLSPSSTDQKNKTALLLIEVVYIYIYTYILPFLVSNPTTTTNNNCVTNTRLKTQRMEWRKC